MRDSANTEEMTEIADQCLGWLAGHVDELERFMALSGYSPQSLRSSLGSHDLSAGLIDYFGRNESLLLAMCANSGLSTDRVMRHWHHLNPDC